MNFCSWVYIYSVKCEPPNDFCWYDHTKQIIYDKFHVILKPRSCEDLRAFEFFVKS